MNSLTKEQVQFSKRLAKWAIISVVGIILCAFGAVSFLSLGAEHANDISTIANTGVMAVSLIVATQMGNSGIEKVVKAKYESINVLGKKQTDELLG